MTVHAVANRQRQRALVAMGRATAWLLLVLALAGPLPTLAGSAPAAAAAATPGARSPARAAALPATGATGAMGPAPAPVSASVSTAPDCETADGPGALHMPVQGVAPQDLRDTYADQRAGGARVHEALDILAPHGTPVLAVDGGRIAKLFLSKPGGITVYQWDPTGRFAYYYAHLDGYAPGLAEGQAVQRGQLLGYVGSTGNADPKAPHLHFGIFRLGADQRWWEGVPLNPFACLQRSRPPGTAVPGGLGR